MRTKKNQIKKILIVDDEESFVLSLKEGLKEYSSKYLIFTASNGKEAIEVLEKESIDLLISDLRMPVMDGFELLSHVSINFPHIPIIVLTAFGTIETKEKLNKLGSIRYLEKPIGFDQLLSSIEECFKNSKKEGTIQGISIAGFVQLISMEKKTCLLNIRHPGNPTNGFLYFYNGELYDAKFGDLTGEEAVFHFIAWDNAEIKFKEIHPNNLKKRINADIHFLILEAMRIKDENADSESFHPTNEKEKKENESNHAIDSHHLKKIISDELSKFKEVRGCINVGLFDFDGNCKYELFSDSRTLKNHAKLYIRLFNMSSEGIRNFGMGNVTSLSLYAAHDVILGRMVKANSFGLLVLRISAKGNINLANLYLKEIGERIQRLFFNTGIN